VGTTLRFRNVAETEDAELAKLPLLSQEQLGRRNGSRAAVEQIEAAVRAVEQEKGILEPAEIDSLVGALRENDVLTLTGLTYLRTAAAKEPQAWITEWVVTEENVGMGLGGSEVPASVLQAANPIFILIFGLILTALWGFLASMDFEPSTPVKFAFGLLQLGLGFGAFWYGAQSADERGMVVMGWLLLGYLLQTTGELCLSPVGLSMVTKLSPSHLVSTVMGMWFLATAFSQFLAAIIAQFTGVTHGGNESVIPAPLETVGIYGGVFGKIAICAIGSGVICLILSPLLRYWMHEETVTTLVDGQ
jgi:POT family proton-dependent oligopeptide transporter